MHDSVPIPPDPESERRGHELRDVAIRPILYFLIGLFVFGGLLQVVMSAIMQGYVVADTQVGVPSVSIESARTAQREILDDRFRDYGGTDAKGDLQRNTTKDMLRMYDEEDAVLNANGGLDTKTGKYHIPIDRAMKAVIEKGLLKSREKPPKSGIDPELPYPMHSQPYRSTY
jgi:hypothetical protein